MGEQKRRYFAENGVIRTSIVDDDKPDSITVQTAQDLEPILDSIHRDREIMPHGTNKLAARLPLVVVEDLIHRGIYTDEDRFKAWLNGPEATPFRIWRGQL